MEKALVGNSADPEQVKKAEKKEHGLKEREALDLRYVLATPQGRRVLYKYLEAAGIFRTSFSENTNVVLFKEGERNFGLRLLADINDADQEAYFKMVIEAKEGK